MHYNLKINLTLTYLVPLPQAGFEHVLAHPTTITYITYSLRTSSHKLRAHVADLLATLCVLSLSTGHQSVLSAFSDFKVTYNETFRFDTLVRSIAVQDLDDNASTAASVADHGEDERDEAAFWEYRAAAMALINALTNGPDDLEQRIAFRDEFARRGLNEVMAVCRISLVQVVGCDESYGLTMGFPA